MIHNVGRFLYALMWIGFIGFTLGALMDSILVVGAFGILGGLAGTAWGAVLAAQEPEVWRWEGHRFTADPEHYRGEITRDGGQTWEPDPDGPEIKRPVWDTGIARNLRSASADFTLGGDQ